MFVWPGDFPGLTSEARQVTTPEVVMDGFKFLVLQDNALEYDGFFEVEVFADDIHSAMDKLLDLKKSDLVSGDQLFVRLAVKK